MESKELFDPEFMTALYELGFSTGLSGDLWTRNPKVFRARKQ
jgi:hypothetical protein